MPESTDMMTIVVRVNPREIVYDVGKRFDLQDQIQKSLDKLKDKFSKDFPGFVIKMEKQ